MDDRRYWLDSKENVAKVYRGVWIACGLLLAVEVFVHLHPHFTIERLFGFYGFYGFVGCVGLVLGAKALRTVLMRPEDYYDEDSGPRDSAPRDHDPEEHGPEEHGPEEHGPEEHGPEEHER